MHAQPLHLDLGTPFVHRVGFRLSFERCVCVDQIRSDEQEPLTLSPLNSVDPISCKKALTMQVTSERMRM